MTVDILRLCPFPVWWFIMHVGRSKELTLKQVFSRKIVKDRRVRSILRSQDHWVKELEESSELCFELIISRRKTKWIFFKYYYDRKIKLKIESSFSCISHSVVAKLLFSGPLLLLFLANFTFSCPDRRYKRDFTRRRSQRMIVSV